MAVTIMGKNYTQISGCESTSDGGTWSGVDTQDSTNVKENTYSLCGTLKASGDNDATFTPTTAIDMSGTKHLRCWYLCTSGGLLNTYAGGGIQIGISDGTNTGFWYLAGRDTYSGGWINLVVDVSSNVDAGTKPTGMSAITSITLRNNQTAGKNVDNVWVDNLCLCDGLIAYGDDGGGYFDFDNIFLGDNDTALGIGIVRKIGGQYFSTGSIEIGDNVGTNGCKFQAKSQALIFEDRKVNASLYGLNIVDNGTGTTEFILGDKVGTAGIQGSIVRTESEIQSAKFYIDGFTDTDVDNFKLYGSTFFDAGIITFGKDATNTEILNCNFESCLQVIPKDASTIGCFFINTSDVDAAVLWNETIDIQDCSFVGNTTGAGIEMPSAVGTPYPYDGLLFSGNTYDVLNSSGFAISINKNNGSDPTTHEGSTVTFLGTSVTTQITVKDISTQAVVVGARVLVLVASGINFPYEASVSITGTGTTATVTHSSHGYSTGANVYIKGADQDVYNGAYQITIVDTNTYTYTTTETIITSPATGIIIATTALIHTVTNASGIASDTRALASDQPISGRVRSASSSPYYQQSPISDTVNKDNGKSINVQLIRDE